MALLYSTLRYVDLTILDGSISGLYYLYMMYLAIDFVFYMLDLYLDLPLYSTMSYQIKALPTVCRLHTMVEKWMVIEAYGTVATVGNERHYIWQQCFLLLVRVIHACAADRNNYLSPTFLQGETSDSNEARMEIIREMLGKHIFCISINDRMLPSICYTVIYMVGYRVGLGLC